MAFLAIPGTGLVFFLCAWILMLIWGVVAPTVGVGNIGYARAMLVTVAIWLTVAPLIASMARRNRRQTRYGE